MMKMLIYDDLIVDLFMNLDYELELMKTAQMQASELNGGASTRADVTAELHHHSRPSGGTI